MAHKIGLGITLAYESSTPGTYTNIGELIEFTPPGQELGTAPATDHSHTDGISRDQPTVITQTPAEVEIAFDPALTVVSALQTLQSMRTTTNWRWTHPTAATTNTVPMILTNLSVSTPREGPSTASFSLQPVGPVVIA
jgi:hypothetical protein